MGHYCARLLLLLRMWAKWGWREQQCEDINEGAGRNGGGGDARKGRCIPGGPSQAKTVHVHCGERVRDPCIAYIIIDMSSNVYICVMLTALYN